MTLGPGAVCRRLAAHAVGRLADSVSIYVLDSDQCHRIGAAHRDPRWARAVSELVDGYPIEISFDAMVAQAVRTKNAVLERHMHDCGERHLSRPRRSCGHRGDGRLVGVRDPDDRRNEVVGVVALIRSDPGKRVRARRAALAETLASRAALTVQNAQLYARQTTVLV